jgi:hypothetical protein
MYKYLLQSVETSVKRHINVNLRNRYKNESALFVVFVRDDAHKQTIMHKQTTMHKQTKKKHKRTFGRKSTKHSAKKNNKQKISTKEQSNNKTSR